MTEFHETMKGLISGKNIIPEAIDKMESHYELMVKWNRTHNLTRILSLEDAVVKHYIDCILGFEFVPEKKKIHDMGSGAGFPGIIGAILRPEQKFVLVEPARKRATFLSQVKATLNLNNVEISNNRAEAIQHADIVVSRGTFSWPTTSPLIDPLDKEGKLCLWVGRSPSESEFRENMEHMGHQVVWGSYSLGTAGQRHIGILTKG